MYLFSREKNDKFLSSILIIEQVFQAFFKHLLMKIDFFVKMEDIFIRFDSDRSKNIDLSLS